MLLGWAFKYLHNVVYKYHIMEVHADADIEPELGIRYDPPPPPPIDEPASLAILNEDLAKIQTMAAKYDEIVGGFRQHLLPDYITDVNTTGNYNYEFNRTPEYMHAAKKYDEYNEWPLYIAIHKMAIKLILMLHEKRVSMDKYTEYKDRLMNSVPEKDTKYLTFEITPTTHVLNALISNLNSGMKMNGVVQTTIDKKYNDRTINRMSNLTRGGKRSSNPHRNKSRKSLRKNTRKSKSNKSIAAAIKDISLAQARADFAALKATTCADINQAAKVGNAAMDHYFFGHRLAAKTKRAISYYDWIKTDWKRNEAELRLYKFNLAQGKTPEKARYGVFRLYYGAIHGFKPLIAKWMYCTYKPIISILDFSAGWGGRCLGAMALGIPYIGIDTNKDLRPVYERMVRELDDSNAKVDMRFQDAATVDYSKFKYDMVLTSPPYFKTVKPVEDYAHMPHYADRADFNARFLFPVIRNTFSNLARGGTYALNIPADMYDEIRAAGILPPRLLAKHRLFLQPRFAKGNPKHPDVKYEEYIYVWKK